MAWEDGDGDRDRVWLGGRLKLMGRGNRDRSGEAGRGGRDVKSPGALCT